MEENKKPCAPVEEESRDTTTVFREEDPLCAALDEFCYALKKLAKDIQDKLRRVIKAESASES